MAESADDSGEAPFNIVMIGAGGVGKSALCERIVHSTFVDDYDPTVEDHYSSVIEFDKKKCSLNLVDTAGQAGYENLRRQKMISGEGFIIVYAIDSKLSFHAVRDFYQEILDVRAKENKGRRPPVIVVGNKADLETQRQVTQKEVADLESELRIPAFESSAKEGKNIVGLFLAIVKQCRYMRDNPPEAEQKKACCVLS